MVNSTASSSCSTIFFPVSVFQAGGQWCSFSCFISLGHSPFACESLTLHVMRRMFFYILPLLIMDTLYAPDVYREGLHPYATSLYILNSKKQNRIIYFCIIHFIFCHFRKWNAQSIVRGQRKVNMSVQTDSISLLWETIRLTYCLPILWRSIHAVFCKMLFLCIRRSALLNFLFTLPVFFLFFF